MNQLKRKTKTKNNFKLLWFIMIWLWPYCLISQSDTLYINFEKNFEQCKLDEDYDISIVADDDTLIVQKHQTFVVLSKSLAEFEKINIFFQYGKTKITGQLLKPKGSKINNLIFGIDNSLKKNNYFTSGNEGKRLKVKYIKYIHIPSLSLSVVKSHYRFK